MKKILLQGLIMSFSYADVIGCSQQNILQSKDIKLEIVQIGDPVLRQKARELTIEEILSPEIQNLIIMMKNTMDGQGVGLAAPQIGLSLQIAVIEDKAEYQEKFSREILQERQRKPVPFHVIINPKLTIFESETAEFFEGCLSVPGLTGKVLRPTHVRVECYNEKAEPITIEAQGWYARILLHEIHHLEGKIYLDYVDTQSLTTQENYSKFCK